MNPCNCDKPQQQLSPLEARIASRVLRGLPIDDLLPPVIDSESSSSETDDDEGLITEVLE